MNYDAKSFNKQHVIGNVHPVLLRHAGSRVPNLVIRLNSADQRALLFWFLVDPLALLVSPHLAVENPPNCLYLIAPPLSIPLGRMGQNLNPPDCLCLRAPHLSIHLAQNWVENPSDCPCLIVLHLLIHLGRIGQNRTGQCPLSPGRSVESPPLGFLLIFQTLPRYQARENPFAA